MKIEQYLLRFNFEKKKKKNFIILGDEFIKRNKNKIKLIFNNKKFPVKSSISSEEIKDKYFKIRLLLFNNISNRSCMFKNCSTLLEINFVDNLYYQDDKEYFFCYNSLNEKNEQNLDKHKKNNTIDDSYNEIIETNNKNSIKKGVKVDYINNNLEKEINNNCFYSQEEMINNYNNQTKKNENIYTDRKETNTSETNN